MAATSSNQAAQGRASASSADSPSWPAATRRVARRRNQKTSGSNSAQAAASTGRMRALAAS